MKRIAIVVAVLGCLLLPAAASARTFDHEGRIVGDDATRVTLGVKVERGDPKRVTNFKARHVKTRCGKRQRISRFTFVLDASIRIRSDNTFSARFGDGEGGFLVIGGRVRRHGRVSRGRLRTTEFRSHSGATKGQLCRTPRQRFRTSAV